MRYIYHPDALTEYADVALYYEERLAGLGADFTGEVDTAIERILEAPDRWHCVEADECSMLTTDLCITVDRRLSTVDRPPQSSLICQ
jgi:toxin ParE1/3/4